MPPNGAEASLMSVRSFVHISAVALALTAAASGPRSSSRTRRLIRTFMTSADEIVVYSDRTQPGFVRAIDLTTNTEVGVFGPTFSGKSNESSDHLL